MKKKRNFPKPPKPKIQKTGPSTATTMILVLFFLMISAYVVYQITQNIHSPYDVATAYHYEANDETTFFGYVVREESVLPIQSNGVLALRREEGERVGAGQKVATLYTDNTAKDIESQLDVLYEKLEHLNFALTETNAATMSAKLDNNIQANLFSMQENLRSRQYAALEKDISELKALVVKREFATAAESPETVNAQIAETKSQIASLEAQQSKNAKDITVPSSGLFSAVVDGYEALLTPETLKSMTPTALAGIKPDSRVYSNVGKMIYGDTWYYAANMDEQTAATYKVDSTVTLRFVKELDRTLKMTVDRVSDSENGQKLVVFRCNEYLPEVTLLRRQSANIIHESFSGIRVPTEAIRVNEGVTGVYCLVGMQASFKPVDIVYQGNGYYLVEPSKKADDTENTSSTRLRVGDSVLITAEELYHGKVIEL